MYISKNMCHPNTLIEIETFPPEAKSVRLQISREITLQQGQGVVLRQSSARNQAVNLQRLRPGAQKTDGFWRPKREDFKQVNVGLMMI